MATATKTPAKRATSKTNAATAVKSTRTSARAGGSAVKNASSKAAGVAAKAGVRATTGAAKKATVKRALNGASAHAPVSTRAKTPRAKSNGGMPAELAGDVQELARITHEGHEGEVVRKTRASSSAGGEAADVAELAVPGQIGGLTPDITPPAHWHQAGPEP